MFHVLNWYYIMWIIHFLVNPVTFDIYNIFYAVEDSLRVLKIKQKSKRKKCKKIPFSIGH